MFTSASRASLIAADVLLIFITWSALSGRRGFRTKNSFSHVLLRDGTIYFICLLILNSVHLVFTELSIARSTFQVGSYVIYFTEPLTAILVSRFMMNLQVVNSTAVHVGLESRGSAEEQSGESSVGQVESVVFQHTIDSSRSSTIDSEDNRVYLAHATTPSA
ncbi:hypothetical protein C8Q74DRAFT_656716 [Fomes fomentarius]|nr:hypothetical protein C8Q74DRAFT_656716 [Fomes fomentarius]